MNHDPLNTPSGRAAQGHLDSLAREADRLFSKIAAEHPEPVRCRPGCDDCCRAVFLVSAVEGFVIARAVRDLPRQERRRVERQAAKAARKYEALLSGGRLTDEVFSRERIDCPLLVDNACALYDLRPITCRVYGVPTSVAGKGRTCPRSGFVAGRNYPTISLDGFEARLRDISMGLVRESPGNEIPMRAPLPWYLMTLVGPSPELVLR
ncbi:MAG: YkgJ family cysteine cluster protein [Proteobacteria bacterium]|nr:YkgJ family cysteine cluster protein [Pseudomonadota bacterium]MBU1740941.1 YkgJ family cysteine cluster protein [Pseudomonadota bacterium]